MNIATQLLPRLPTLLGDIVSQLKPRRRLVLASHVVEVPGEFVPGRCHQITLDIVGSYDNRVLWQKQCQFYTSLDEVRALQWDNREDTYLVYVGDGKCVIFNPPAIKLRPFPNELFELYIHFPKMQQARIHCIPLTL